MLSGSFQIIALGGLGILFFCFVLGMVDCHMEVKKYEEEQCQRIQNLRKN